MVSSLVVHLGYFLTVCLFFIDKRSHIEARNFKMGLIVPTGEEFEESFAWETGASATTIAIEKIEDDATLLAGHTFSVVWVMANCDPRIGTGMTVDLRYEEKVDLFVGAPCSLVAVPAGRLASYWNLPFVAWVSRDPVLADKSTFTTMARIMGPLNKVANVVVKMFENYDWNLAVIVSSNGRDVCGNAASGLKTSFHKNNITVGEYLQLDKDPSKEELDIAMQKIKERGRIVIICNTDVAEERKFMLSAFDNDMTSGDYVFISLNRLFSDVQDSHVPWRKLDGRDEDSKDAYETILAITVKTVSNEEIDAFRKLIPVKMAEPPFNHTLPPDKQGNIYSPWLHDAVMLFAIALNKSLEKGNDPTDGEAWFENVKGLTFEGMSGSVVMDDNGDRDPDYSILDLRPNGQLEQIAEIYNSGRVYDTLLLPVWAKGGLLDTPTDRPKCGFVQTRSRSTLSCDSRTSSTDCNTTQVLAWCRGTLCVVKKLSDQTINLKKEDISYLRALTNMNHENINKFIGACIIPGNNMLLCEFCPKGTLSDILDNDDVRLEWLFKCSFIFDLVQAMEYIHKSDVISHGNLKSTTCVIDKTWVLKVTGFPFKVPQLTGHTTKTTVGSYMLALGDIDQEMWTKGKTSIRTLRVITLPHAFYPYKTIEQLWTAPELLRQFTRPLNGSQKGDVYSFGIVLQEIIQRNGPFPTPNEAMLTKDIVNRVKNGETPPFRPKIDSSECEVQWLRVILSCLSEDPLVRPTFTELKKNLISINNGEKPRVLETLTAKMEKYADNLEDLVEERTQQLILEKKKTDRLLYRMLPPVVADKLKMGAKVNPESYDLVTIFFSDISGFEKIASASTPFQIVDLLNDVYTCFDEIIEQYDVYKVETINDAYIVASGLPKRNGTRHASEIADMSLDMLNASELFRMRHVPREKIQLRIGVHSGTCAAGVIGKAMPRYCLFGDTVNVASRMQSHGEPLKIHCSKWTHHILSLLDDYIFESRGNVDIKGKGCMETYWLQGKKTTTKVQMEKQRSQRELT
ncbi:atrial natriuretic peptide receptor 1-like [Glandiceps talaboti]